MEAAEEICRKWKHGYIDDDDEVALLAELQIEEEAVVAVMRKLEEEIRLPSASSAAVSLLMRPDPRVSIVSGGRDLESCGSSFSDSSSTVMASVDGTSAMGTVMSALVGGPRDRGLAAEVWPWAVGWPGEAVGPSGGSEEEEEEDDEEEWLARVLAGPVFELEECFI